MGTSNMRTVRSELRVTLRILFTLMQSSCTFYSKIAKINKTNKTLVVKWSCGRVGLWQRVELWPSGAVAEWSKASNSGPMVGSSKPSLNISVEVTSQC